MANRIHVTKQDDVWGYVVGDEFTQADDRDDAVSSATQYVLDNRPEKRDPSQGTLQSYFIVVDGDDAEAVPVEDNAPVTVDTDKGTKSRSTTPTTNQDDTTVQ